jgi:predicted secreted Zn-dependent protease
VGQILPTWQPTPSASQSATNYWNPMITKLTAHENGHVDLARSAGARVLAKLQALLPTSCASLSGVVETLANSEVATLAADQQNYDVVTNHGLR